MGVAIFLAPILTVIALAYGGLVYHGSSGLRTVSERFLGVDPSDYPVVGILMQPAKNGECPLEREFEGYVPTSYYDFASTAGIKLAPIPYTTPLEEIDLLLRQLNGFILPGIELDLQDSDDIELYQTAESHVVLWAEKTNLEGNYFPVVGISLGFHSMLSVYTDTHFLDTCDSAERFWVQNLKNKKSSRAYHDLPEALEISSQQDELVYENQSSCLTAELFYENQDLEEKFLVTATEFDRNGVEYVSSVESKKCPFYGFQYQAQKQPLEWTSTNALHHAYNAAGFSRYLADFLGNEFNKSEQKFDNALIETKITSLPHSLYYVHKYFEQTHCFFKTE